MSVPRIVLASQSPRRAQLLAGIGLDFHTHPADIDETYVPGEDPAAHAERLAREKALTVAGSQRDALVIGSDTVVVVDGDVLGKPVDEDDAVRMLMRLQGREHEVVTGLAVVYDGTIRSTAERVAVRVRAFDEVTAREYAATGEPLDKAGAYGIQGYGATLVAGITGDYYAVMGLPICGLIGLLHETGLRYNFRGVAPVRA